MIKFFLFKKKASRIKKISARNRLKYQNYILCTGAPLALAALSVVIYTRVGEIMLGSMAGVATVAIYSSASSLASGWAIIPLIFMTSLLPKVIADKSTREKGFSFIHLLCLFIAGPLAAFFYCYSDIIILKTYGNEFLKASEILPLLSISSIFVVIGVISAKAIANKGGYKYLMIKTIVMSIFNVVLTFFLIKKYNIQGAAYSLLITEILSSTIANYFFQTKYVLNIHINIIYSYSYIFRIIKPKIKG
jgi:O-antigen/teichoic acid export membrane protein